MTAPTDELAAHLTAVLMAGVSEEGIKRLKKSVGDIMCEVEDDITYRLKDELAPNLSAYVVEMANKTVTAILEGNESELRRYLSCGTGNVWTGRSTGFSSGNRSVAEMHPVIHGTLHEQGCIKLRRDIVNAHRDLLVNERILDLEDQVASLTAQVNKANAEKDRMWERLRSAGG